MTLSQLNFIVVHKAQFSLDPEFSDFTVNQSVLDALVGTLVKYGPSGKLEPYLAESWTTSGDQKVWTFNLRRNLKTEDGELINASSFIDRLCFQLTAFSKRRKILEFEKLRGWEDFIAGQSSCPSGLRKKSELEILFEFDLAPYDLIEFLRMPYFGFYASNNFDRVTNKWKGSGHFISSGPYQLADVPTDRRIVLEKRDEWFSVSGSSPKRLLFTCEEKGDLSRFKGAKNTILMLGTDVAEVEGLRLVRGTPSILTALVLSPYVDSFFQDRQNRQIFVNRVIDAKKRVGFNSISSQVSNFMFPSDESKVRLTQNLNWTGRPEFAVQLQKASSLGNPEQNYILSIVEDALSNLPIKIEYRERIPGEEAMKRELENREFTIRLVRVDVGTIVAPGVINMMFCSDMGARFPDPDHQICNFIDSLESSETALQRDSLSNEFNQLLADEAYVIPLFHSSLFWLYSEDIDVETIAPIPNYPRFENLRIK